MKKFLRKRRNFRRWKELLTPFLPLSSSLELKSILERAGS
jgi:hypothetical protein